MFKSDIIANSKVENQNTNHCEEEIDMGSLVDEEPDGVPVYGHLEDEVWRGARLDCGPDDTIMMRMDQSLVQVQHQHLLTDHVETMSRDGRQRRHVIADGLMLLDLANKFSF